MCQVENILLTSREFPLGERKKGVRNARKQGNGIPLKGCVEWGHEGKSQFPFNTINNTLPYRKQVGGMEPMKNGSWET